jgi:hypothetical protein
VKTREFTIRYETIRKKKKPTMPQADAAASKTFTVTTVHECVRVRACGRCTMSYASTARTAPGTNHVQQQVVFL